MLNHVYLGVSKVDLHDESYSDPCGEGETGRDDDGQPVPLAGAVFFERVSVGLLQGVVTGQV